MDEPPDVSVILRAAFAGELSIEDAADALHDLGVREVRVQSVLPKGQSRN